MSTLSSSICAVKAGNASPAFTKTHRNTFFGKKRFSCARICRAETSEIQGSSFPKLYQPPGKEGLLFGKGDSTSWDSGGLGTAVVRRYLSDNEERWCMWYQGWSQNDIEASSESLEGVGQSLLGVPPSRTGLATSANGIHWSRGGDAVVTNALGEGGEGMIMDLSNNWWTFDTHHLSISDVLIMSSQKVRSYGGVYWMYYSGGDREDVPVPEEMLRLRNNLGVGDHSEAGFLVEGLRMRPGLAMSNDGKNWARIEGEHHTWSLFDVGADGDWDSLFVASPQVVFHGDGDLRMYYHSFSLQTRKFTVGFARSRDGLKWVKYGKCEFSGKTEEFDEMGVASRHVVRDPERENGYLMAYEGVSSNGTKSIGLARSKDGLWDWERVGSEPILAPSLNPESWDCASVGSPNLVDLGGGRWRLYYVGVGSDGTQGIGMAETLNLNFSGFKRWQNPVSVDS